jgi:hypothetical protein
VTHYKKTLEKMFVEIIEWKSKLYEEFSHAGDVDAKSELAIESISLRNPLR